MLCVSRGDGQAERRGVFGGRDPLLFEPAEHGCVSDVSASAIVTARV
jgi:hypothetical protein